MCLVSEKSLVSENQTVLLPNKVIIRVKGLREREKGDQMKES